MGGAFTFKDQIGYPVEMLVQDCYDKKFICIDWCEYLADAGRQKDWKFTSAVSEMEEAVGKHLAEQILTKFKQYFMYILAVNKQFEEDNNTWINVCEHIHFLKREAGRKATNATEQMKPLLVELNDKRLEASYQPPYTGEDDTISGPP